MSRFSVFLLLSVAWVWSAKPMEPLENYNVIMVHGAADSKGGIKDGGVKSAVCEHGAYDSYGEIFGSADMMGHYYNNDEPNKYNLLYFLDSAIFENVGIENGKKKYLSVYKRDTANPNIPPHFSSIYLQRPFLNPAESPRHNAREIGDGTWKSDGSGCLGRRSLIEEAQEVKAEGRDKLKELRKDVTKRESLPPSRNIIIAHSMGGIAAREYVQTESLYRNDVDKVIALDSPHEGTGALDMLIEMNRPGIYAVESFTNWGAAITGFSLAAIATSNDPISLATAFQMLLTVSGMNAFNFIASQGVLYKLGSGYDYHSSDPLVDYINPNYIHGGSVGILNLRDRPYTDNLPMMRLLYGTNSMTFTDPSIMNGNAIGFMNFITPRAFNTMFYNLFSQISGGGSPVVNYINSLFATEAGLLTGIAIGEHGTALIPEWSGKASKTKAFEDYRADVMLRSYNGHIYDDFEKIIKAKAELFGETVLAIAAAGGVASFFGPAVAGATKMGIAVIALGLLDGFAMTLEAGVNDLQLSHKAPTTSTQQSKWKAEENTYSKISGDKKEYTPYRMEEFLYEKPFVNLRVASANDLLETPLETNLDSLGLLGPVPDTVDNIITTRLASLAAIKRNETRKTKLAFKDPGDWERLGVKLDRWEKVKGVEDSIPIRHADRYAMPDIAVDQFIETYRFIVDDLMPHRLRQIRINFNFMEDIAWECYIGAKEDATDACAVYMRSSDGKGWIDKGKYPHPVKKDGTFDFNPGDFYNKDNGYNLSAIQKDNQNTVSISTTNKIGLSNSQRFYYLFKATKDLIEPLWPISGAKLTSANGFQIHANALDYDGYIVQYGKEQFVKDTGEVNIIDTSLYKNMPAEGLNTPRAIFTSKSPAETLAEGSWNWHYEIGIKGAVWAGAVPFAIDTTPPKISLEAKESVNPGAATFMARFANDSKETGDESLRLVYMRLDKMENETVENKYDMPLLTHVIAPEFGVGWDGLDTSILESGKYRINAVAFDGAVGSLEQHTLMNDVITGAQSASALFADFDSLAEQPGYNASLAIAEFVIDKTAPEIISFRLSAADSSKDKPPHSLDDSKTLTLNKDRLLRMNYTVVEPLYGRNSTQISVHWEFLDKKDSAALHRLGDKINIESEAKAFLWEENSQMQLPDGDYIIRMKATDAAGNESFAFANKSLHVDRTPPAIIDLATLQRVYSEAPANGYAAVLEVKQGDETAAKLKCYYRISGPGSQGKDWTIFADTLVSNDIAKIRFSLNSGFVGTESGKRYLESGCMDAAGNFASAVDIFHIGHLTPTIVYPAPSSFPDQPIVVIRGLAPAPASTAAPEDGYSAYRLRWRANGGEWRTDGIDVGASKLNDSTAWISKEIQVEESDLGFWDRRNLPNGEYWIELSTRQCEKCPWVSETVKVGLNNLAAEETQIAISIDNPASVTGGEEANLSARVEGAYGKDFRVRFYGKDSEGNSLFDKSSVKIKDSPLKGEPSVSGDGIWLWSKTDGEYHLQWNGLPESDSLLLSYRDGSIADICKNESGQELSGCREIPFAEIPEYLEKASGIPAGLNKAMSLSGSSGHLTFSSKNAFYAIFGTSKLILPVHLGAQESKQDEELVNISRSITVNPALYGLSVHWDGLTDSKHYPSQGIASIHAEVFENFPDGIVLRSSREMIIEQPALEITTAEADTLADFYVISQNPSGFELGSKTFSYGIRGRDAIVKAWIENESGDVVKNLLGENGKRQNAVLSNSAYTLLWAGDDEDNFTEVETGIYKFVISAKELNGDNTVTLSRPFKLTVAGMQMAQGAATEKNGSAIKIAEAVYSANSLDRQIYAPTADYFVKADIESYTLPENYRTMEISYEADGDQEAIGYKPKRFSLGLKRQRDSLDLVILHKMEIKEERMSWKRGCNWRDGGSITKYGVDVVSFTADKKRANKIEIDYYRSDSNYGFGKDQNYLKVWAVLLKNYGEENYKYTAEDAEKVIKRIEKGELGSIIVWQTGSSIVIPHGSNMKDISFSKPRDASCKPGDSEDDGKICNDKTKGYNPHANLLNLTLSPGDKQNRNFFSKYEFVGGACSSGSAYLKINFDLELEIPDREYWNAGYGYDNLVNRTIRLDHTNVTIFGSQGYLSAAKSKGKKAGEFYDGSNWKSDNTNYGMLTPFEIQRFNFISANDFALGSNAFLFPDEGTSNGITYKYPSRFYAKFYNTDTAQGNFRAYIQGECAASGGNCYRIFKQGEDTTTYKTELMKHGATSISVTLEANHESAPSEIAYVPYPASSNWIDNIEASKKCPAYGDPKWKDESKNIANCMKFYRAGSNVHYYHNDYDNDKWKSAMTDARSKLFKNELSNAGFNMKADSPETMLGLATASMGSKTAGLPSITAALDSSKYDENSKAFYLKGADIDYPITPVSSISAPAKPVVADLHEKSYRWDGDNDRLLFYAHKQEENAVYRYTNRRNKETASFPSVENPEVKLSLQDFNVEPNPWVKSVSMSNPKITQLNGSDHTHFEASKRDSSTVILSRIPTDVKRPAEFVAVHGRVPGEKTKYQVSYIVNNKEDKKEFHTFDTGFMGADRGADSLPPFLKWLDVNRLQGNTSFFLSWGGEGVDLMYRKMDLYIGKMLNGDRGVVKSLFGEVSVTFPAGAIPDSVGVTVRTANSSDYPFTAFNNVSLRGPIVEVLPSMEFTDSLPRIKARISKEELGNLSPSLVRLYKVDFKNEKFVPLDGTLIGFLRANGKPALDYEDKNGDAKMCEPANIYDCKADDNWAYILISAETRTFSVFAALDSRALVKDTISFAVLPKISTNRIREVKVAGADNYSIYASDKPKWNAEGALQVPVELEKGANGEILVSLPNRLDSWLYLVALNENGEETSDLPIGVHVQLIPSEITCAVPLAPLWLGLDNGYLEFPQDCNQPAIGILQLRQNGAAVAEARQALPDTLRWDGKTGSGKIAHGDYSSRYIALGAAGHEMQAIGPSVSTDTLRPAISNWSVEESSALLDKEFRIRAKITDDHSGVQSILLAWNLGDAVSGALQLRADSSGSIDYAHRLPRKQLAQCAGCKLKISLIAEDKGHNRSEQEWQSGRLWPYPADLALWYPAQEGGGKTAKEYTGTGHDLDLLMPNPWQSASGIYFENSGASAAGIGQASLGTASSYTFETWVSPGYNEKSSAWSRILGFNFSDGRRVDLRASSGGDVRLLDGSETWTVPDLLSQKKSWSHLAVAVDGEWASFYIDGQLAKRIAAVPSERLWHGSFSLGTGSGVPSFAGHLMQVRLYKKALTEEEVRALFSGLGLGDGSRTEIALAGELNWKTDGVSRGFTCAVPGTSYWETSKESSLSWKAYAEQAASYSIFLYARSAQPGSKAVKAGVSGALASGTALFENVWRPVALQNISLPLKSGFNDIELRLPEGIDVAGIAISSNQSLLPSQISWKSENAIAAQASVATQVRFEGSPDPFMIRPRVRLQNIGESTIYGPKVRYYFRGEDPAQVLASKYYPQEGNLIVRQESDNLGYAEWSFPETTVLPAGQLLFWGEGPHFGLHNTNYVPWVTDDDASDVIVLDSENRLLGGSCFENEHPLNAEPAAQVLARDSRAGSDQASQLYIRLENIGQVPIRGYEVRYSFYVPGNAAPELDVYDMQGLQASLKNLGSGRWQVSISGSASLGPGISWANPAQFALHFPNWQSGWNASDDPSHIGLSAEWALAQGIEVFDDSGNRIYGSAPAWPAEIAELGEEPSLPPGSSPGYQPIDPSIGSITRLPNGLLVSMLESAYLSMELVNAAGTPQKFIYQGTLGAGENIVPADWTGVDFSKNYLAIRLNGRIATRLLSTLGN